VDFALRRAERDVTVNLRGLVDSRDGENIDEEPANHSGYAASSTLVFGHVARFVEGSVCACGSITSGIVKIPVAGCRPLGQLAAFIQQGRRGSRTGLSKQA
jgi:hypothetical protein